MIILDNVSLSYENNNLLSDINLYCMQWQITILHWCNGSWKSTILSAIIWNHIIDSWKIIYKNKEKSWISRYFWYMPQDNLLFEHLTCYENIIVSISHTDIIELHSKMKSLIDIFWLNNILNNYPHQVSLGQKQLFSFIRAILIDSDYIILDEPTSALESKNIYIMKNILIWEKEKNKTILIISHDTIFSHSIWDKMYQISEWKIIKK